MKPGTLRSLPAQSIAVVAGDSITVLALILSTVILARLVSPDEMAIYRQVAYLTVLLTSLLEMGLGVSVYYFWNHFEEGTRSVYLRMTLAGTITLGLVGSGLLALLSQPLGQWFHHEGLGNALLAAAPYTLGAVPFTMVRPALISQGLILRATLLECLITSLAWAALIFAIAHGATVAKSLAVWSGINLLRLPTTCLIVWPRCANCDQWWKLEVARAVWRYAWPLQLSRLPSLASSYFDKILGSVWLRPADFASYSLGARELPLLSQIPFSLGSVLVPRIASATEGERTSTICEVWRNASTFTALVTYPLAAFCVWNSAAIVELLYTSQYSAAAVPFGVFAALTFVRTVEFGSIAKALGKGQLVLRASLLGPIAGALVAIPLAQRFGITGLSTFAPVATVAIASYLLVGYRQLLRLSIQSFFPWGRLLSIAAISFVAVGVGMLLSSLLVPLLLPGPDSSSLAILGFGLLCTLILYAILIGLVVIGRRTVRGSTGLDWQP